MDEPPEDPAQAPFRVTFVTGVTPDKWVRTWRRRSAGPLAMTPVDEVDQLNALRGGDAEMAFVRLPVDREGLHVIPLYREVTVVVVSTEHPVAAYDEVAVADLADEHLLQDPDAVPAWREVAAEVRDGTRFPVPDLTLRQAVESVAAQAGIIIVPASVARVHQRKDVVAVRVTDLEETQVGLAWSQEADDPRIEAFIGVVRGRTERSSRGESAADPQKVKSAKAKPAKPAGPGASGRGGRSRASGRVGRSANPGKGKRRR